MVENAVAGKADTRRISWVGWALTVIVVLVFAADAAVDLFSPATLAAEMTATGFPTDQAGLLGLIIVVCVVLYAIPRTAVLGAILLTGFLGGAICTHFRLGEIGSPPQLISLLLGGMAWGGLYLRDERVRRLLPIRSAIG
ncbi:MULTISPECIES: DoxX family protein [unclassified Rhizobium]|uniref:DoxX family protein n=1 Tax=unclassified Rhizobium TaxID=2613769 RepID=UPI000EA9673D|nr:MULTISPECIES: DoxX family protein [unclassified Rhizobium]AYG66001.1 DoxX family protein [Rhizobium sp. CCGE531]AYG72485.1 DoxX family protein [Rhizobium sp. CCGE532]